jgi:hypothetical protein
MPNAVETYNELRANAEAAAKNRKAKGKKKSSKDEGLFKQVNKAIQHLQANPKPQALQTHPYHSLEHPYHKGEKVFEAYIQNNTPAAHRVFWCYGPKKDELTVIAITAHP